MKAERAKHVLDSLAHDIPEDTNLWPAISARLTKDTVSMNPRTKLVSTLLLVLLALAIFSTAAYAFYRYFLDPGLQHVNDSGMITNLDATAQPTSVVGTPVWGVPQPATQIGETQTQDGITLTLNWIYVNDGQQAIGFTVTRLGNGLRLGLPAVTYSGVTPEQFRGAVMQLDESGNGMLVTYQIVREGVKDSKVNVSIDLPVMRAAENISTFHFDVRDAPVDAIGGGGGNSYAVRVNGIELRQEYLIITPAYTEARVCYPKQSNADWQLQNVTLQFHDELNQSLQDAMPVESARVVSDETNERCALITFPLGSVKGVTAVISIGALGAGSEQISDGWQFYTVLSNLINAQGATIATPTPTAQPPLAEETIGDLKAILDWAYADANRIAFHIHFEGWQKDYFVNDIFMRTADGSSINSSIGYQPAEDDPSRFTLDFEPMSDPGLERFGGELIVMVSNDQVNFTSFAEYHFKLDLPIYPAVVIEPIQKVSANGIEMILQRVKITPSFTYAYICFNKPTTGDFSDWQVAYANDTRSPQLKIGAGQTTMSTGMLIFDSDLGDIGKGPEPGWVTPIKIGRCMKLGFPVGHRDKTETLTLTIPALEKSVPEVIPDADVKRAQEILKAQGIVMTYATVTGNGGGGSTWLFPTKPAGMTDTEAYQKFIDALGYVHPGPWVFSIEIKP